MCIYENIKHFCQLYLNKIKKMFYKESKLIQEIFQSYKKELKQALYE